MKKKAVIYGLGKGFEAQKKALEGIFEIVGVSDRKRREREDYVAPEDIHRLDFDCVICDKPEVLRRDQKGIDRLWDCRGEDPVPGGAECI